MSNNVKGLRQLISTLERIPKELEGDVEGVLEVIAQDIELDAKRKAPVGTPESTGIPGYVGGTLRKSIKAQKVNNKTYEIRANATGLAPYAPFVEFGTRFMRAQPFLFPAFFSGRKRFINALDKLLGDTFNKV